MKNFILSTLLLCLASSAFAGARATADFMADKTDVIVGETVNFTDETNNNGCGTLVYAWDFGAGANPTDSEVEDPTGITYSTTGPKTVTLTVEPANITSSSCTDTETKVAYINVRGAAQDLPVLSSKRLFLFGVLIFGTAILVMGRFKGGN